MYTCFEVRAKWRADAINPPETIAKATVSLDAIVTHLPFCGLTAHKSDQAFATKHMLAVLQLEPLLHTKSTK